MVYEGKHAKTSQKGRYRAGKAEKALIAALWMLFLAVFVKLAFPGILDAAKDAVLRVAGGRVDFGAAAQVLGEAVSGERSLWDAFPEAWRQAFQLTPDTVEVSGSDALPEDGTFPADGTLSGEETLPGDGTLPSSAPLTPPAGEGQPADPTGGKSNDAKPSYDAMVEEFKASQTVYAALELPGDVTYERPDLRAEGNASCEGIAPCEGRITSGFGYREHPNGSGVKFHYGVDIGAKLDTPVTAFFDGKVLAVGDSASYGVYVIVEHGGFRTLYAHLGEASCKSGDALKKGDAIGLSGESGNATGPCLHFEIIADGVYVNPAYYM